MPIESWFPLPIFYDTPLDAGAIIENALPHLFRLSAGKKTHQTLVTGPAYSGSNAPDRSQYLFKVPELRPLYEMINLRANEYARALGLDLEREHIYMGRSWVNILERGGSIEPHNHVSAAFSGAFYLQVPEPAGSLRFTDPKEALRREGHLLAGPNAYSTSFVDYPVREGLLLLFPGYAKHGMVAPNVSELPRVSLSFDYFSISLNGQSPPPPPRNLVDKLWKQLDEEG